MHTKSINFESFVEWDNSPFILFSNQGKILYLNHTAEILFAYVSQRELYDISLSYAPKNFGYKTTTLTLGYETFLFHAISVGYENEHEISLRLYHTPRPTTNKILKTDTFITTDINILLEANIALFRTKNSNNLRLLTDHDLPPFKIDQNTFSKILRKSLDAFSLSSQIYISLKILISQYIIIENEKKSIVQLRIKGDQRKNDADKEISNLCIERQIKCFPKVHELILEVPLLL
ncbi:hypothetical protein MNB_SV-13-2169 [hydrothermal vent metagenome]|uniref:PAS domain-containing protein n=1 Tax=hydrothermal vent metagenome TaxID=652676 RepID=A0A1W1BFG7_9ZZZZ